MKILLDHCVPRKLREHLNFPEVYSAEYMGWQELTNGKLLQAAKKENFEVVITTDKKLAYQQNMQGLPIAVIQLLTRRNRLNDLLPLMPALHDALKSVQAGEFLIIRDGSE